MPISPYATSIFKKDSQLLFAINTAQERFGIDNVSLTVALVATLAAGVAVLLAFRGSAWIAIAAAGAVALSGTIAATHADLKTTRAVRAQLPHDLSWVDHGGRGRVTAIETPIALKQNLLYELYWNPSIQRELLLGTAVPTDVFRAPRLQIRRDGALAGVRGDILFHDYGTTGRFANATKVASMGHFTLWRTQGVPRLRLVFEGRFWDGWLSPTGRLRAWPQQHGSGVAVSYRLALPKGSPAVSRVRLGRASFLVRPGTTIEVTCDSGTGPLDVGVHADQTVLDSNFRSLSVRLTRIAVRDHPPTPGHRPLCR